MQDKKLVPGAVAAEPGIAATASPSYQSLFALQAGVVAVVALYFARDVLIPITVAGLLSFLLGPLVSRLRRMKVNRIASVILAALLALAVLLAIGVVIGTQLAHLLAQLPEYVSTIQSKIGAIGNYATDHFPGILKRLGLTFGNVDGTAGPAATSPLPGARSQAEEEPSAPQAALSPMMVLTAYVSPVLSPVATAGIVFVVAVFILLQKEDLRDRMIRLFGSSDLHRTTGAMDDAARRLSRYFLTLLTINVGFGIVIGTGLFLIGVPSPILWGILGIVLRFIPYVGPILAATLPIALSAAVDPGWSMVVWTAALFVVTELIFNQIIEPVAYGQSTGLSPFSVIVAALFWGWLWGPIGLILSMPLTLCLVVLGRHVERLEFLDVLLGDRPALSPPESFYQRMLAGDPDEAQDHAEVLLQERSLSSYYDEIALKGLQLAADDLLRGVLRPDQLERVRNTAGSLIDSLSSYEDVDPTPAMKAGNPVVAPRDERQIPVESAPAQADTPSLSLAWQAEQPVLCLAGKGPLDEAASMMLAQLLGKHGLGGRVAAYEAASRNGIAQLDLSGVTMICISYLDISGSPSHLRYLIRRLKQKAPGIPILVGLWPAEDSALKDVQLQGQIGANYFTTSLREAVNACVDAAVEKSTAAV
jgi:predicted PurR-regulated permease PerM